MVRSCRLGGSPTTRPVFAVSSADGAWRVSRSLQTQTAGFTVSATTTGEFQDPCSNNGPGPLIHTPEKRNQTLPREKSRTQSAFTVEFLWPFDEASSWFQGSSSSVCCLQDADTANWGELNWLLRLIIISSNRYLRFWEIITVPP